MKRAQPNEIVATYAPQWVYLRTGLKAVMPPFELNPERAQKLLELGARDRPDLRG